MKKLLLALLLLPSLSFAQSVQQSGNVTRNHLPAWVTSGVISDGGSSAESPISSMGVTNNGGAGICVNSDHNTAAGRNQLCFGAATSGAATISLQNSGTAPAESIQFIINGTAQGFPTVSPLPVTVNDLACFGTTAGGLKDCGSGATLTALSSISVVPANPFPASSLGYTPLGLLVTSTSDNAAETGFVAGQNLPSLVYLEQNFGGSNINNGRNGLSVLLNMTAASNASNAYKFYVGSVFQSQTSVNDGGTGGAPTGVIEGTTAVGILKNGATNWLGNFGAEFAISNQTGSSSKQKAALRLTEWPSDAVAGSSVDAFLAMSSDTSAPGLTQAINIDNSSGATPLNTSATILKIGSAMTITNGFDLSLATFTGNVLQWKSSGNTYSLSGSGSGVLNGLLLSNLNFTAGSVSVGTCTGIGASGTCAVNTGSGVGNGKITLTVAGAAPAASGAATLTFSFGLGPNDTACKFTPQNGTGAWLSNATVTAQTSNTTTATFVWANAGTPLTAGSTWQIEYQCLGF